MKNNILSVARWLRRHDVDILLMGRGVVGAIRERLKSEDGLAVARQLRREYRVMIRENRKPGARVSLLYYR